VGRLADHRLGECFLDTVGRSGFQLQDIGVAEVMPAPESKHIEICCATKHSDNRYYVSGGLDNRYYAVTQRDSPILECR
jgi:hypothetical protein